MDYRIHLNWTTPAGVIAAAFAVSIITSAVVAAGAYRSRAEQYARSSESITVKGSTRQRIRADKAAWRIDVQAKDAVLPKAYAQLDVAAERVRCFLTESGFSDGEIGVSAIRTITHMQRDGEGNELPEVAAYTLVRTFVASTTAVDRVNQVAGRVTELIRDDLLVISQPPEYYYTKLPDLRVALLASASQDARARAESISTSTGCALGEVRSATMGVLQVTRPDSTEVADYGMYDTSTIEKDVTAVVTVTFGLR